MKKQHIRIGSLNARSIFKGQKKTTQKQYITYLKSREIDLDIICLQELSSYYSQKHLTEEQEDQLQRMFPNTTMVYSKHCAIICFNKNIKLTNTCITKDERCISTTIQNEQDVTICQIANVYAPAQQQERLDFLESFHELPQFQTVQEEPWMIIGDFNTTLKENVNTHTRLQNLQQWLKINMNNCFPKSIPTFKRGNQRTMIDYMFAHHSLAPQITNTQQCYLPSEWTDHALLQLDFLIQRDDMGPGVWRFNPTLLSNKGFTATISMTLKEFYTNQDEQMSTPERWECLKNIIKYTAQEYSKEHHKNNKNNIHVLQRKRMQMIEMMQQPTINKKSLDNLKEDIVQLEHSIEEKIRNETTQYLLRSATKWHEQGERSNKYFFRVIKHRQNQQSMQSIRSSETDQVVSTTGEILKEARNFYVKLFTPDESDQEATDELMKAIPEASKLTNKEKENINAPVSLEEMKELIQYSPRNKSPGLDGIPFELYQHIMAESAETEALFLQVLREAWSGSFPPSWQQTRMVLLFKKGDPQLLKNWRPLSLINTDAKIFTKLITNRIKYIANRIINPYQTGFLPKRLISDNGWLTHTLMSHLKTVAPKNPHVAVLLDQEKAYDRVHPIYLGKILEHFGFPTDMIATTSKLFFGTKVSVSINGWLAPPFTQNRGLRQGDPLSPILFNLAFEPLLRFLLSSTLTGIQIPKLIGKTSHWPRLSYEATDTKPIKILSYADDLQVFLTNPSEWPKLIEILSMYGRASNAKVNLEKTVVISLSGYPHSEWIQLINDQKMKWHDKRDQQPVIQLGYPMYSNPKQLDLFFDQLLTKIMKHIIILKGRHLSIRGKSLITNALLTSKLWHVLRVVPASSEWMKKVKQCVITYTMSFWPRPAWHTVCRNKEYGGLGIIDIQHQQLALHMSHVQQMLRRNKTGFLADAIQQFIQVYTGHSSILPTIMFPTRYKYLFKNIPTLYHMCTLISKLPPLRPSTTWAASWLRDLPLCETLENISSRQVVVSKIKIKNVVADVLPGSTEETKMFLEGPLYRKTTIIPQVIARLTHKKIGWHPWMSIIDIDDNITMTQPPDLMPNCDHWTINNQKDKAIRIELVRLKTLRHLWHSETGWMKNPPKPPLKIPPSWRISKHHWKYFWKQKLDHKVLTPWWRLIQDSIGTRAKLWKWQSGQVDSEICKFCNMSEENIVHFAVQCPKKWTIWYEGLKRAEIRHELRSPEAIWRILALHDIYQIEEMERKHIGRIYAGIWRYHWHCTIQGTRWDHTTALNYIDLECD